MKKYILFLTVLILYVQGVNGQTNNSTDDGILKILAIGNSFSEDGIENYLFELAQTSNKQIVIGNMYIGGASLQLHVKNANSDKPSYSYRKIALDGHKKTTKNISISQAIKDENWDYISLQQASPMSGQYDVIMQDLPQLLTYAKTIALPTTQYIYHQTWAYQKDSSHKGFANYDRDQGNMYNAISNATRKINKSKEFAFIVPAGTAIQNARTSSIGDTFTRDGYHLNLDYGRFAAACTWYEMLFQLDVRKNTYKPQQVTELQSKITKASAHKAVKKPYKISKVKM